MSDTDNRLALSNDHWSLDQQIDDVMDYLRLRPREHARLIAEFPEFPELAWAGSWIDAEASGVDPEYMSWLCDAIENRTPVYWEDGEPWILESDHLTGDAS